MEALIFIGFIVLVIVIRVVAGGFDGDRIDAYFSERGYTLVEKTWEPFGPGWFGEKDSRIYSVVYRDREGNTHHAHIKTSMLSGVYLSNDRIVKTAPKPESSIEQEKAALRKRLAELDAASQTDE